MNDWIVSKVHTEGSVQTVPTEDKSTTTDSVITDTLPVKPPLTEYERIKQHPYTFDYLKMADSIDSNALYDVHYRAKIDKIDKFIVNEIARNKLQPTIESYDEMMSKIKGYLNISPHETIDSIISKLEIYMKTIENKRLHDNKIKGYLHTIKEAYRDKL